MMKGISVAVNIQTSPVTLLILNKASKTSDIVLTGIVGLPKKRKGLLPNYSEEDFVRGFCDKTKKRIGIVISAKSNLKGRLRPLMDLHICL